MKKSKLIFYLVTALLLTSCGNPDYEDDYFVYRLESEHGGTKNLYYMAIGLTELGKQQKVLAIPETFNDLEVVLRGGPAYATALNCTISSRNLEKLFVPYTINAWERECFQEKQKIITITNTPIYDGNTYRFNMYVSSYLYENANKYLESIGYITKYNDIRKCHIANVSYHFNYEGAPNVGYYWLDDYDYGEQISYIPKEPIREGYIFSGWYKEKECINKWDFELDRLPNELLDEENEIVFQETMLYAKWI